MSISDISSIDRHPDGSIMSLIPELSCRACQPHAPFAQISRLSRERPETERHRLRRPSQK